MTTIEILMCIGSVGTLLGALVVIIVLTKNHDWNRRQYAINILRDWNNNVLQYNRIIEQSFPNLFDTDLKNNPTELTKKNSIRIYTATSENEEYLKIRHAIHELLNHLEYVTTAYTQNIADKKIIEDTLKKPLMRVSEILKNYLNIVAERRGYQPWQPYLDVVSMWQKDDVKIRNRTDS